MKTGTDKENIERKAERSAGSTTGKSFLLRNRAGKLILLIQLVLTGVFLAVVWNSALLPGRYLAALAAVLIGLFIVLFGMQFLRSRIFILGIVLSILIDAVLGLGAYYVGKTSQLLDDVGGAEYKTDNMIAVVRADDSAETIYDAKEYTFAIQNSQDQENTGKMVDDLGNILGGDIRTEEYETVVEEAQALLDGEVGAAIYNEAFTGIIEEAIEGYPDQVRILYQYGIDTYIRQEAPSPETVEQPFSVYISGIDVAGPITTNSRSDVNIIMTINPNTNKILLTTTPRDYYVPIPDVSGGERDKLTHAGIYGVDVSMATLESIYGIDITYYARVNFTSLINIVDALGGVDVNSEYAFEAGGYQFQEGTNHLDGEQALAFSRERHSFAAGDNQRGKNQEAVLTGILQKAMSPAILANASEIITSVSDCVETNMTRTEMARLINRQIGDGGNWRIEAVAATGRGDSQPCYSSGSQKLYVMWPDEASTAEISGKMQQILEGK